MNFYLDTSSIRKIPKDAESSVFAHCHTSCLALIELISGITKGDRDFSVRSSSIKKVFSHKILVDYRMVDAMLTQCFGAINKNYAIKELRIESLKGLLGIINSSSDRKQFEEAEKHLNLKWPREYFEELDKNLSVEFRDSTNDGNSRIRSVHRTVLENRAETIVPDAPLNEGPEKVMAWLNREKQDLNRSITIYSLAQRALAEVKHGIPNTRLSIEDLYDSYDDSINAFVMAFTEYSSNLNLPDRNDGVDLAHFLYLSADNTVITEDVGMRKLCSAIGISSMSLSDLMIVERNP